MFGGTFDPPHVGHLAAARAALDAVALDRVLWIPAATPPHKARAPVASARARRRMVEAAVRGRPGMELCDLELRRGGPSYTVDTVRALVEKRPEWSLALVMGADLWAGFPDWREAEAIAEMADVVVASRPGFRVEAAPAWGGPPPRIVRLPEVPVSSSAVRARLERGSSVEGWLSRDVLAVVEEERLYRGRTEPDGLERTTRRRPRAGVQAG